MPRPPVPHKKPPHAPMPPRDETEKIAGLPAVRALFAHDPGRAERLFYEERFKSEIGGFCALMAKHHKPYRMVSAEELAKIAGTPLHGGIVAISKPKRVGVFDPLEAAQWAKARAPLLVLDGVGNPHNLGAIARTMAFFGLERLLISDHPAQAEPSEAAFRVAEGGLEWVEVIRARKFAAALKRLKDSYRVVGTALGSGRPLAEVLSRPGKPVAMILGNEEEGLPPATLAACDDIATIPGSGKVQSLNVAATAAILIHELAKNRR
ncbi:RNA methyltransferase [Candidatus Terasakiella magnetica]|nr:RNA methyltransferase [Candidatus Terasakiella magnetica]